ncbi:MAG TPA: hypothetical protein DDX89_06970 [Candidatus Omnitrophica bacterium]|nr:MAG: hypothetical protein A2Z92_02130 [Omnitrophica WOR_2 bacterium GWA2_63_20]OGX32007.1 MAG: hypothetical protein A3E56_00755 [Omnitrophica WOR_2 bacterium RIFCSPHIGHO2_12_FULL_64_13]OGX35072.1 MAG: hypothetical protein A3B73_04680 [Omnitrophica WOR_2 bacterium RIFCSPHIGHO2_02_FULL_63_39]OGX45830.1 MAG: hypothetical protein A3I71_05010 [Omnitrophica WOR_2 bacterium RIFCSPLOWO2_02_FULL_63_16]OGX49674.1 MAG: hypothetical protein A3G88_03025 [Omnitrophica WOR_2 bacterium RIFCSPLOWO2_12_FULL_6
MNLQRNRQSAIGNQQAEATRAFRCLIAACLLVASSGCARWPRQWGAAPCRIAVKPAVDRESIGGHLIRETLFTPIEHTVNVVRLGRRLAGVPARAVNLKDGQVADSAFFTNRDLGHLTAAAVRWGPTPPGDLPQPPCVITKAKTEGKTPGFFVKDARGIGYLFKLDPVDSPELLSGAEVTTSKLLYVLGYHVPSYEIAEVRPEELQVAEGTMQKDVRGRRQTFDRADLDALIQPRLRQGVVRVSASRLLEGDIVGPARFRRFRDCAEVRALKVVSAWVNNIDTKDHNTLLVWDGSKTTGYVIDFGTSLGADAGIGGPKSPCAGWTNIVDLSVLSTELLTLGMYRPPCETQAQAFSPAVGLFSFRLDPRRWKPYVPNPAFEEMNDDDARWIARRIAQLTRAHLEAAVSAGRYSNPADASRILEVLEARRRAILEQYEEGT